MATDALRSAASASQGAIGRIRLLNRLSAAFLLDLIEIARQGGHPLDTLILAAISQANMAEISRRADLQIVYAEPTAPPPDELRRPISLNALAASLGLPFETVRRRARRLARMGACRFVEGGVIVPAAVFTRPEYFASGLQAYERTRSFYYRLADLQLLGDLPAPSVELTADAFPLRAMARLTSDYVLREVEALMAGMQDLVDALLVLAIFEANVAHLPDEVRGGEGFEAKDMVADALRRPVSIAAVSRRLGLSHETTRRHAAGLLARGVCRQAPGGIVLPAESLVRPLVRPALTNNRSNLQRLFSGLSQLGVLKLWDQIRELA